MRNNSKATCGDYVICWLPDGAAVGVVDTSGKIMFRNRGLLVEPLSKLDVRHVFRIDDLWTPECWLNDNDGRWVGAYYSKYVSILYVEAAEKKASLKAKIKALKDEVAELERELYKVTDRGV